MTPEQFAAFAEASDHPYSCKCKLCRDWWEAMGPEMEDDDTPDGFGPFGEELPPSSEGDTK